MSNVEELNQLIGKNFSLIDAKIIDQYQVSYVLKKVDIHRALAFLKSNGYRQLSYLSCVDWPEDEQFEMIYIVMNWDKAMHVLLHARIDRKEPTMDSILSIYPGSKYYEREAHEFFGVAFPGNPDYEKQLILEQWDDIPPMRKDFDPKAYSDRKYTKRDPKKIFTVTDKSSKKPRQNKREERANNLRTGGKK
ncbi:MAG: NADH-quinone oxidoreductase subunit C [Bacteroidales bacterium]|nr:NADH-quinone oxidoreductase subunit C [Bacteroidales bacterium]